MQLYTGDYFLFLVSLAGWRQFIKSNRNNNNQIKSFPIARNCTTCRCVYWTELDLPTLMYYSQAVQINKCPLRSSRGRYRLWEFRGNVRWICDTSFRRVCARWFLVSAGFCWFLVSVGFWSPVRFLVSVSVSDLVESIEALRLSEDKALIFFFCWRKKQQRDAKMPRIMIKGGVWRNTEVRF